MLKQIRILAVALAVLSSACATAPPEGPRPQPRPGEELPPDVPVEPGDRDAPLRVGLIVSNTGSSVLEQYADLVTDGVLVAEEAGSTPRRDVEIVVRDDGGTVAGAERAVRELEGEGVRVIVGPLVDEALLAAARARTSEDVVIISPTAVSDPFGVRNAYALNVVDTRGAEALGEYARRWPHVGVLYGRLPETSRQARAFIDAYSRGGGQVTEAAFPAGATNITDQLTQLREAGVQALFFPASEREIQSIMPQLEYAGLDSVQMLGNESWVGDAARRAPQRVLQGAVVATPLFQESRDVAWEDFVERYEAMHRRSLTNPVPALGYDAASLALLALTSGRADVTDFRGATGVLSLHQGTVTRRPFLVRIDGSRLIRVN